MEAVIVNYVRGKRTVTLNQMIIKVSGIEKRDKASQYVGKKVTWTSTAGKNITGEVRSAHGNSGAIRVLFETGMPGQAIGQKVSIQ